MEPTLVQDDELVVLYKRKFERFDIIIIHIEPEHYYWSAEKYFVKRIIGLPGERVDYRYNPSTGFTDLYINNQLVEESFFKEKDSRTVTIRPRVAKNRSNGKKSVFTKKTGKRCIVPDREAVWSFPKVSILLWAITGLSAKTAALSV